MGEITLNDFVETLEPEFQPVDIEKDGKTYRLHRELTSIDAFGVYNPSVVTFIVYQDAKSKFHHIFFTESHEEEGHDGLRQLVDALGLMNQSPLPKETTPDSGGGGIIHIDRKNKTIKYVRDSDYFGVADKDVVLNLMEFVAKQREVEDFRVVKPDDDLFLLSQYRDNLG